MVFLKRMKGALSLVSSQSSIVTGQSNNGDDDEENAWEDVSLWEGAGECSPLLLDKHLMFTLWYNCLRSPKIKCLFSVILLHVLSQITATAQRDFHSLNIFSLSANLKWL